MTLAEQYRAARTRVRELQADYDAAADAEARSEIADALIHAVGELGVVVEACQRSYRGLA